MSFLKRLIRKAGRAIKKTFRFVGKAFGKVFGAFGKLGPIGSIALMFILPGLGEMWSNGLGWLQTKIGTTAVQEAALAAAQQAGTAAATTAASTAATAAKAAAAKAAATTTITAAEAAAQKIVGTGWLGSTNKALQAVGKIGRALIGDANSANLLATSFSWQKGIVGNMGAVTNNVTSWLKKGLMKVPGAEPFEDWLNKMRGKVGFKTNTAWEAEQQLIIDKGITAEQAYTDALTKFSGVTTAESRSTFTMDQFEKSYFKTADAGSEYLDTISKANLAQTNLNRNLASTIAKTEEAFKESWQVDPKTGNIIKDPDTGKPLKIDEDAWDLKKTAATAGITTGIQLGIASAFEEEAGPSGIILGAPEQEAAKDYYVQNMMQPYQAAGYQGVMDFKSIYNSPFIYGDGGIDWLAYYSGGLPAAPAAPSIGSLS